jgi:hypothetical protein
MANGKGRYVTKGDCREAMSSVATELGTVKKALVGDDMRGGIVKDIAGLNGKVDDLIKAKQCGDEISLKWKLAIFSASISSILALIGIAVKLAGA